MRDILFRGKRLDNGEWVYGTYVTMHHNDGHIHHFIIPNGSDLSYGVTVEDIFVEIDENTVCRYIGLTDKNEKQIFQDDILDFFGMRGKVVQVCGNFLLSFPLEIDYANLEGKIENLSFWSSIGCISFFQIWWDLAKNNSIPCTIIGNDFDNFELLEMESWKAKKYNS